MSNAALALKSKDSRRWIVAAVGDVCRLINGRTYKKAELLADGRYRVLRVGNFFTNDHWYFSDLELEADKYCEDGDLLYAWSASFGPRIWAAEKVIYHYHIWKVQPDAAKVSRDFLFYFFEWDKELIRKEQGAGATMTHVSKESMEARAIPLPPLEEQKLIVAVLDQAFAALDHARANAEANLADSEALLQIELLNVFGRTDRELNNLSTIFKTATGGTPPKSNRSFYGDGIRFVKPPELQDGVVGPTADGLTEDARSKARIAPAGAVLVSCIGNLGKIGLLDAEAAFNQQINAIFPNAEIAHPRFVYWECRSSAFREQLKDRSSGTTVSIVNKAQFNQIRVWVPPLQEQANVVAHFDRIENHVADAKAAYAAKLQDLAALRQSLLQKAFAGELA